MRWHAAFPEGMIKMRIRTFLLLLLLFGICLFAAINWPAFTAPTSLSLLVSNVEAPLGLIMLGLIVLLTAVFAVFGAWLQTTTLLESRSHARELQTQRKLADQAEASRITDMQNFLAAELQSLREQSEARHSMLLDRLEQAETALRAELEQNGNTLAAYIGELEDRLEHGSAASRLKQLEP